jgi:putative ABC transport system substrate-binding protein
MRIRALALAAAIAWLAVPWSEAAAKVSRVGMLWYGRSLQARQPVIAAFKQSLGEQGFVEGQNLLLEHRHAGATLDGLPALAAELVRAKVDVIVAVGPVAIRSARQATATTPIVMLNGDPAMFTNLARPGGNVTGLTALAAELAGKQMDLLKEAIPGGRHRLPAIAGGTEYALSGGLMEFVPHEAESFRAVARYVARILRGANPGELPIEQPTRFQLTLNLGAARALGVTVPPSVLLRADEVIQ